MAQRDLHGLPLSTASEGAALAFNHAVMGYLKYRADTPARLAALMTAAPDFAMAHVLKGYMTMLSFKLANVPAARSALEAARSLAEGADAREAAHAAALSHWIEGDLDRTLGTWEHILDDHPRDVLAFRLHHFIAFWLGRPATMAREVERAMPKWSPELAGWGPLLACRCFAHEELGNYTLAEDMGRAAIDIDPGDLWAAHAVAHVLEMQGRRGEGIAWLAALEPNWEGANNLAHHLWWHRGLYHYERREFEEVLGLYDRRFRNLNSPLTQQQPDVYIDIQNAASMLYRLERQGVDVGGRWTELADKAEVRIGDCLNAFTLPHWMLALTGAKRWDVAERFVDGLRRHVAETRTISGDLVERYALPICEAILASARGAPDRACDLIRPAIGGMYRLGGSHAQQDVLEQVALDCALKAGRNDDVRLILERVAGRHPVPPDRRVGYADAARRLNH
jgi:tetratricopeptide (TPR) repeat protein